MSHLACISLPSYRRETEAQRPLQAAAPREIPEPFQVLFHPNQCIRASSKRRVQVHGWSPGRILARQSASPRAPGMRLSPASLRPGCRCWKEKGFLRGYRSCLGTAGLLPSRASQGEERVSCQYDGRLGRWFPGQPLRVPGYTCTQAHVHTHGDTRAHSPALTHDVQEDVARSQDHLLPRGAVVDAHVALVGAVIRDADLGQPAGGTEEQNGDLSSGAGSHSTEKTNPQSPTVQRSLSNAPGPTSAHPRAVLGAGATSQNIDGTQALCPRLWRVKGWPAVKITCDDVTSRPLEAGTPH